MTITFEDILRAAAAIAGDVIETPVIHSRLLSELSGADLFLKMENLQYTASFKERGALNKLRSLTAEERRRGVITMSAGNHALGVACHAQRLGIPATIVMPRGTPFVKVANTRYHKATVVLAGETLAEAAAHAAVLGERQGLVFVHPFDDPLVIAGQGTVALELLKQVTDLDAVVVPVGGGGLIAGCAVACRQLRPTAEVIGVQSALYPSMLSAVTGSPPGSGGRTIAEGIAVETAGMLTRAIVARLAGRLLTVDEAAIERAVQMLAEIEKTIAEGAGAAGIAAVFAHPAVFAGRRVGVLICGGNIDMRLLASVLMRGLARAGRLCWLRAAISDAPGELAKLTGLIGAAGASIVEIRHDRLFHSLSAKMAEIDVVVETRDARQIEAVLADLERAGFAPRRLDVGSAER